MESSIKSQLQQLTIIFDVDSVSHYKILTVIRLNRLWDISRAQEIHLSKVTNSFVP